MGQGLSSTRSSLEHEFYTAAQAGDLEMVERFLADEPALLCQTTVYDRLSALHIAAANGRVEVEPLRPAASHLPLLFLGSPRTPTRTSRSVLFY